MPTTRSKEKQYFEQQQLIQKKLQNRLNFLRTEQYIHERLLRTCAYGKWIYTWSARAVCYEGEANSVENRLQQIRLSPAPPAKFTTAAWEKQKQKEKVPVEKATEKVAPSSSNIAPFPSSDSQLPPVCKAQNFSQSACFAYVKNASHIARQDVKFARAQISSFGVAPVFELCVSQLPYMRFAEEMEKQGKG